MCDVKNYEEFEAKDQIIEENTLSDEDENWMDGELECKPEESEKESIETGGKPEGETQYTPKRILLSQASLDAVVFASNEESRYNLNSLHVTDKYVEASNGYMLLRLYHNGYNPEDFPVTPGKEFPEKVDLVLPKEDLKKVSIPKKSVYSDFSQCLFIIR